ASLDFTYREGGGVRREHAHRAGNLVLKGLLPVGGTRLLLKASAWDESSNISETGLTQEEFEADPYSLPFSREGRFDVRRYAVQALHGAELGLLRLHTNAYLSHTERASWRQSGESEERLGEDGYAEDCNCAPTATSYTECGNQGRPRTYLVAGVEPRLSFQLERGALAVVVDAGGRLYGEDVRRRQFLGNTPLSREDD